MRRLAAIALLGVALAGCGSSGDEQSAAPLPTPKGDFGPTKPGTGERHRPVKPPEKQPSASVAQALAAGMVGVIGVEGDVGVRPKQLDVSADGTLEQLEWESWGDTAATGTGQLRLRDCDPTCAGGGLDVLKASVKLSSPRLCGRETYFDRATVSIAGEEPPATYVRAPC